MPKSKNNEKEGCCPECGECENLHFNYDYEKPYLEIINVLCNECGKLFDLKYIPLEEYYYDKLGNLHKKT